MVNSGFGPGIWIVCLARLLGSACGSGGGCELDLLLWKLVLQLRVLIQWMS